MLFAGPHARQERGECRCRAPLSITGIERVNRETIQPLAVWNKDKCASGVLQRGAVLSDCRILRDDAPGAEPYAVEFSTGGHRYSCPLFAFQPRTRTLALAVEHVPEASVAV